MTLIKGKRKYLFCADVMGSKFLDELVDQAMVEKVPFDIKVIEDVSDVSLEQWFSQQKMGTFLYLSGSWEYVNQVKKLAFGAGFSEHEMQINVCGSINKKIICCRCYGENDAAVATQMICKQCGLELEVSDHYSRRLDGYLGYATIK